MNELFSQPNTRYILGLGVQHALCNAEDFLGRNSGRFTAVLVTAHEYVTHLTGKREPVSI